MMTHLLVTDNGRLDPFMVQAFQRARLAGRVVAGHVQVDTHRFAFVNEPLPEGAVVQVWLNAVGFCAVTEEELATDRARMESQEALRQRARNQAIEAKRSADRAFHADYALPFCWSVGIKDRLSGLGASSQGDGRSRTTVEHLRVFEPFNVGRLTRHAGDFLCTSTKGTNGRQWVDPPIVADPPAVTCPRCLALMERWHQVSRS